MADNSSLPVASGNETFANDDIGGVKYPRPKINWGPDGTANDVDVASGKPLPIQLRSPTGTDLTGTAGSGSAAVLTVQGAGSGTALPVTGTITAVTAISNALPAGTNAIGKLAANSGVDIGDVDVTTIAGVAPAFGSGANGATVLRTALATDSPGIITVGTAGSPSSQVVSMQGVTGGTPVPATGVSALRIITMSTDTSAYTSGDLIADTQQYDGFFRVTNGTGIINTITVTEKDAQGAAIYIIIHRTSTSMGTENSAPNISDANLVAGIQHIIPVAASDYVTVSGTKIATLKNLGLPVMAVSGTDDIYFSILNSTGTPTYASGEIQLGIGVMLD